MANASPAGVKIYYDNASGTPVDITAHVLTVSDIDVEELTEEVHPFGSAWEATKGVGVARIPNVTLGGLYEDSVLDPLFANRLPQGPGATTRTLKIEFIATSKSITLETVLVSYKRQLDRGALAKYEAVLAHAGGAAPTEA